MHTTFKVKKKNAVMYQLSQNINGTTNTIVSFETRHTIGHKVTEIFALQGLDINNFVDDKGNPNTKLIEALYDVATAVAKAEKKPRKSRKTIKQNNQSKQKPYGKAKK